VGIMYHSSAKLLCDTCAIIIDYKADYYLMCSCLSVMFDILIIVLLKLYNLRCSLCFVMG
jgi:hypothetical protein